MDANKNRKMEYENNKDYQKFVDDLWLAGYVCRHYRGRNFYEGPAIEVDTNDEIQDIIRATSVRVQWDSLGMGYIVYPR